MVLEKIKSNLSQRWYKMIANTKQVKQLVNEVLNNIPYNYCNNVWVDRDWRKPIDDGKRRICFEIVSGDLSEFGRKVKQAFISNAFDNTVNVTTKYIRVASIK